MLRTLLVALLLGGITAALAEEPGPKPKPVKPLKAEAADPADKAVAEALKTKKVTFDFVDTKLADAVAFMRQVLGVNIILDPEVNGDQPITVRVQDMAAGKALGWLARVAKAEMKIEDGAVYIVATEAKGRPRVYKVAVPEGRARLYPRMVGRAQIKLGEAVNVELNLYDDELPPETREMLLKLLHEALARELAEVEKKGK